MRWMRKWHGLGLLWLGGCFEDVTPIEETHGTTETTGTTSSDGTLDVPGTGDTSTSSAGVVSLGSDTIDGESSTGETREGEAEEGGTVVATTTADASTADAASEGPFDPPLAVDDAYLMRQREVLTVSAADGVLANDVAAPGTTVRLVDEVDDVDLEPDGSFVYTPPSTFWGEIGFDYVVTDGHGGESVGHVRIMVAPQAVSLVEVTRERGGFAIDGDATDARAGFSAAGAGDFNGDGFDDLVLGAPYANRGSEAYSGRAYVVYGGSRPRSIGVGDADAPVVVIEGVSEEDNAGFDVIGVGDVNADGFYDVSVGARRADVGTVVDAGRAYVVAGRTSRARLDLAGFDAGGSGFPMLGEGDHAYTGEGVGAAGDVNGDGVPDFVVGARLYDASNTLLDVGRAYVVFGSPTFGAVDLADIAAGTGGGFVLLGEDAADELGYSVSGAGDVDGDGLADVIVGARLAGPGADRGPGRAYVVFGKRDSEPVSLADVAAGEGGFAITGEAVGANFGGSVAGVGDVDGDGLADVLIGARLLDEGADNDVGRAYLVFGKMDTMPLDASAIVDGDGGFAILGERVSDEVGNAVGGGNWRSGDIDGDGRDDLLIGGWGNNANGSNNAGRAYVVYGRSATTPVDLTVVGAGQGGFAIDGEVSEDRAGGAVDIAGDVNGDGFSDIVVGASFATTRGVHASGRTYVVFGGDFTGSVGFRGTADDDVLTGTSADEVFVGGAGDDRLIGGGGADVIYGGPGDDEIVVSDDAFHRIDGGHGRDTLRLDGSNLALDFSARSILSLQSIEILDLGSEGSNRVRVRVLDIGRSGERTLRIVGEGRVEVLLEGASLNNLGTVGGGAYRRYSNDRVTLDIANAITVTLVD